MKLDIIIPVKDSKVKIAIEKTIPSVLSKLRYNKIFVITKKEKILEFDSVFQGKIQIIDENTIVDKLTIEMVENYFESKHIDKSRAGWYFQQFLKLGISKSNIISDLYLIWDADNIALKPISFFSNDNKVLLDITSEYHKPYFEIIEKLTGIK